MALAPGIRLGPYEVVGSLGAGGMGEVYRARDTRLNRDVALKVLPEAFAADPDRLARFRREAQVLASLNHPNIAAIHGLEEPGDHSGTALVLELVEGPTLADRLAQGALPVEDALRMSRQVAEALEAAHDRGVVHRDLKPANIKLRDDGAVKVLDFGLAKAIDGVGGTGAAGGLSNAPTITSPAMTRAGVILGTAAYMAPEQARGKPVDKRADVWAFGVVLYEALTGARLFGGAEVSDTLALVLTKEPDWAALPAATPAPVRRVLRRCLEKDRKKRLADIADARLEIDEALLAPASSTVTPAAETRVPRWRRLAPWTAAAVALALFAVTLAEWAPWQSPALAPSVRVLAQLGTSAVVRPQAGPLALAPDGSAIAFVARSGSLATANLLYVRRLDRLEDALALPGTENAGNPFFSADGKWVAFYAAGALRKVPAAGGGVSVVCDTEGFRGGSWTEDGTIVFGTPSGLWRVPAAGGRAERLTTVQPGEPIPMYPQVLPGGQVLYSEAMDNNSEATTDAVFIPATGTTKVVLREGGASARYLSSGHLTFVRNGTLFAVPFDVKSLDVIGIPIPVVAESLSYAIYGLVSVSESGLLAYLPAGTSVLRQAPVVWLDRSGATNPLRSTPSSWAFPRFSPDGRRLAVAINDGRQTDIRVYDWQRDILTRVTSAPGADVAPVWTPDGAGLVFGSNRGGGASNLYWQRADGIGEAQRLTDSPIPQFPDSFSPDGRHLAFHQGSLVLGRQDLMVLPIERDEKGGLKAGAATTFLSGPSLKSSPRFSPDGRWVAYTDRDSVRSEIYVQPFPGPGPRVQVSSNGGNLALWSSDNHLFYDDSSQSKMMVVSYSTTGGVFTPSKARVWSEASFSANPSGFDLHPDGQRFAVAPRAAPVVNDQRPTELVLVFNFLDELRRLVPVR